MKLTDAYNCLTFQASWSLIECPTEMDNEECCRRSNYFTANALYLFDNVIENWITVNRKPTNSFNPKQDLLLQTSSSTVI